MSKKNLKKKSEVRKDSNFVKAYEDRATLGYMPADFIQANIEPKAPPISEKLLRQDWSDKERKVNASKLDAHRAEQQTKEARNLKEIIGTPFEGTEALKNNLKTKKAEK